VKVNENPARPIRLKIATEFRDVMGTIGEENMSDVTSPVRDISDTARWVAYFRARETQRPDALFRDPYAERLAGPRGYEIANTLVWGNTNAWAWTTRTYLFDQFLSTAIAKGADLVLNLAAGLDARPYRMALPPTLKWLEVDLPEILSYKEQILAADKPQCQLERIGLDLSDREARRKLFAAVDRRSSKAIVVTEGLLIYFTAEDVGSLAMDLATSAPFRSWVIDLASPGQLKVMQRTTGKQLSEVGASFRFGPPEGASFFLPYGWEPKEVQGILRTAAQLGRAPAELLALLPEPKGPKGNYPWTGVCMLEKR
jgi:methyltransferase (TIGR00027 family)